jgi:hypothetical protein
MCHWRTSLRCSQAEQYSSTFILQEQPLEEATLANSQNAFFPLPIQPTYDGVMPTSPPLVPYCNSYQLSNVAFPMQEQVVPNTPIPQQCNGLDDVTFGLITMAYDSVTERARDALKVLDSLTPSALQSMVGCLA